VRQDRLLEARQFLPVLQAVSPGYLTI
jgi:hypothetical protein